MTKWACLAVLIGFLWPTASAEAKYASIIIDADSGIILHQVNADDVNYPASLTKMMTLYLVFEGLRDGRLKLDQQIEVSTHAASRAPSKLGLLPGETIPVRDIILGLVTKSANDAAAAVAEALAGSESAFAERMTLKARRLGMRNTVFYNASGLPERTENRTTARDLATLARALYRDFPKDYHYFATREFTWRGAVLANHNHLMNAYPGMDGIKTGYINASGFNLAASAVRGQHRLIGIVMGGQTARARDVHMAELLNEAFARDRGANTLIAKAEEPAAVTADDPSDDMAETPVAAHPAEASVITAHPAGRVLAQRKSAGTERWALQLGAFTRKDAAEKTAHSALAALRGGPRSTVQILSPTRADKERLYRARLVNFTKHDADKACHVLRLKHHNCSLVAPSLKVAQG